MRSFVFKLILLLHILESCPNVVEARPILVLNSSSSLPDDMTSEPR